MASWFSRAIRKNTEGGTVTDTTNTTTTTTTTSTITDTNTTSTSTSTVTEPKGQSTSRFGHFFSKIMTTLAEEKERFMNEKEEDTSLTASTLPLWMALNTDDDRVAEEARTAILGLTRSKRNFLNAPPEDAGFTFSYGGGWLGMALAALQADPKLTLARFYLVPSYIKEDEFWRNWFYRVHIILEAYGLAMPTPQDITAAATASIPSLSLSLSPSPSSSSSLASSPPSNTLSVEDALSKNIEKELGELGIHTAESNPEAWEEELKRELSSLDPSKEGPDSLLSQNWEEELMLELGLSTKPSSSILEAAKPLATITEPTESTTESATESATESTTESQVTPTSEPTTIEPITAEPTPAEPITSGPTPAESITSEPTPASAMPEPVTPEPITPAPTTHEPTTPEPTIEPVQEATPE